MRIKSCVAALVVLSAAVPAAAQDKAPRIADPKIASLLQEVDLKYEVDEDKDYKIVFDYSDDKRSQVVFVDSDVETVDGTNIRSVFAPAANIKKTPLSKKQLDTLLVEAGKMRWGQWEVMGDYLYYTIKMMEPFSAKQLDSALRFVSEIADNKEIELSGKKDDF